MRREAGTAFDPELFIQFEAIAKAGSWYEDAERGSVDA